MRHVVWISEETKRVMERLASEACCCSVEMGTEKLRMKKKGRQGVMIGLAFLGKRDLSYGVLGGRLG